DAILGAAVRAWLRAPGAARLDAREPVGSRRNRSCRDQLQPAQSPVRRPPLSLVSTASMHRVRSLPARLLPHGWFDLVRQVLLFFIAYNGYRLVRGMADDPGVTAAAFEHAR